MIWRGWHRFASLPPRPFPIRGLHRQAPCRAARGYQRVPSQSPGVEAQASQSAQRRQDRRCGNTSLTRQQPRMSESEEGTEAAVPRATKRKRLRRGGVSLDLLLRAGRGGLEQLDLRRGVLLELLQLLLRLLEGRLQLLEEGVVLLLGVRHRLLQLRELRVALLGRHGDVLLQLGLLLRVAVLHGVDRAAGAKLGRRELLERSQVAAALVVLALLVGRVEVLDGRVAPNTVLVAQRLAGRGAVNVSDENLRGILELSAKGVPIGLHLFAVASPRRQELDEGGLARLRDLLVEVVRGELDGRGRGAGEGSQQGETAQHG